MWLGQNLEKFFSQVFGHKISDSSDTMFFCFFGRHMSCSELVFDDFCSIEVPLPRSLPATANVARTFRSGWKCGFMRRKSLAES